VRLMIRTADWFVKTGLLLTERRTAKFNNWCHPNLTPRRHR
jgi:hypothetical protein